jgi:hypothetical protein
MPDREDDDAKRERGEGRGGQPREIPAVVDRIEDGDLAVLSIADGKRMLDLPLSRLPAGTRDGDHLRLTFDGEPSAQTFQRAVRDRQSRADAADRVRKLQERLEGRGGAAGKKDFKL